MTTAVKRTIDGSLWTCGGSVNRRLVETGWPTDQRSPKAIGQIKMKGMPWCTLMAISWCPTLTSHTMKIFKENKTKGRTAAAGINYIKLALKSCTWFVKRQHGLTRNVAFISCCIDREMCPGRILIAVSAEEKKTTCARHNGTIS